MGDISAEPSMEEILSSIKRIIAEEGEGARPAARRPQRPSAAAATLSEPAAEIREVLELSEPMPLLARKPERAAPQVQSQPQPQPQPAPASYAPAPAAAPQPAPRAAEPAPHGPEPIVSHQAAVASRGSLDALTRLVVRPEDPQADNTLEGLVRELLRPMLREWLDAQLPEMVEAMVAREIERITGAPRG